MIKINSNWSEKSDLSYSIGLHVEQSYTALRISETNIEFQFYLSSENQFDI